MTTTRLGVSLVLALVVLSPAHELHGQGVGGLIKRKVGESVKAGDRREQSATADEQSPQSKLPRKLSDMVVTSFKRGLEVERDHRQATVKLLAAIKTREQYNACQQALAMSPEMQKVMMSVANLPENATAEQSQKAMQKMQDDMVKLLVQRCGEDPGKYHDAWRRQQMDSAEAAGVRAFSAGLGASGGGGPFLSLELGPDDDRDFYRLLKEWIPPFCSLSKEAQQQAAEKGIRVPGSGKGISFVYTGAEAALLMQLCPVLMPLLNELA